MTADAAMTTAKDHDALRATIRLRARVAKADVDKGTAILRADIERQLSAKTKMPSSPTLPA